MKKIITIISFIVSGIFIITGFALFAKSPLSGIFSIALATVIFPKTKEFIQKKFRYVISGKIKAGAVVVLLIAILVFAPKSEIAPLVENNQPKSQQTGERVATTSPEIVIKNQSNQSPESRIEPTNNSQTVQPQPSAKSNQNSAECRIVNYLPDSNCTPGAIDSRVTQENIDSTICVSGYTATVRPPTSVTNKIKTERMQAYGDTDSPSNYELDHFIPLELGGSPDSVLNLFPEPYANPYGAREKDKVENYLHKQVCNGTILLQTAQQEIRTNWVEVYDSCCKSTNTSSQTAPVTQTTGKYYTSSYATSKYYYPESCSARKSLSQSYLKAFDSLEALLAAYPSRVLSPQCQ